MEQGESMATDDTAVGYVHSVQVPNKLKTASKFIANAVKNGVSLKTQLYKITNEVFFVLFEPRLKTIKLISYFQFHWIAFNDCIYCNQNNFLINNLIHLTSANVV